MVKMKVVWAFIQRVGFPMLMLTLVSAYFAAAYRSLAPIFLFCWLKLIVDGLLFYFWTHLRGQEIYYYYNLGIRKRALFSITLVLDMSLFVLLHFIISLCL